MPRRKTAKDIPPHVLVLWEEMIKLLIKGDTEPQIAHKTGLGTAHTVREMISKTEFQAYFKQLDSKGFKAWQGRILGETKVEAVQSEAQSDAPKFYTILRDTLLAPDNDLRAKERLDGAIKALQMSGVTGDDAAEEVVVLSPAHLDTIETALNETACVCVGSKQPRLN